MGLGLVKDELHGISFGKMAKEINEKIKQKFAISFVETK